MTIIYIIECLFYQRSAPAGLQSYQRSEPAGLQSYQRSEPAGLQSYYCTIYSCNGVNQMWILKDSKNLLECIINVPLLMQYIASKHVTYILFNLKIVNFPFLCSNILVAHAYGLHISHLITRTNSQRPLSQRTIRRYVSKPQKLIRVKCTFKDFQRPITHILL